MHVKIRVGIIYGGKSFEHEVSKMTAKSIIENIDRSLFEVKEIYINKNGNFDNKAFDSIDVAFLAVHGPNCEDGKLQYYLEKKGIKYTGSGIKASKINMSKILMHDTFTEEGLPVVKYISCKKKDPKKIINEVILYLTFPVFVKPDNAGSSVGISKVDNKRTLELAIIKAFKHDDTIVIEESIQSPREIEIGILGNDKFIVSKPGEILSKGEFYSYETKYLKPFETTTDIKNITPEQVNKLKKLAKLAYQCTGCRGYARVDFFIDQNGIIFINEINTLPGFTKISMFPKLMQKMGIGYKELITRIINLALE